MVIGSKKFDELNRLQYLSKNLIYKKLFGSFLTVASYIGWPPKCSNIAACIDLVAPTCIWEGIKKHVFFLGNLSQICLPIHPPQGFCEIWENKR